MKFVDGRDEQDLKDEKLESQEYYEELSKNVKWHHKILLNRPLKIGIALFLTAVVVPILIYFFVFRASITISKDASVGICAHPSEHRIQCGADDANITTCSKNCCFDEDESFCYHMLPSRFSYMWRSTTKNWTPRFTDIPYTNVNSSTHMKLYVNNVTKSHLNFVFYNPSKIKNYPDYDWNATFDTTFDHKVFDNELFIEIYQKTDVNKSKPIMSTSRGPLIVSRNYMEWNFYLSDDHLYGMGELILKPFKSKMWYGSNESQSAMPFVMAHKNGSFHGLYLEQENGMELSVAESRLITVRSFSDAKISAHFFHGTSIKDVHKQFVNYIGKSKVPPYKAMGIHFCRSSYPLKNFTVAMSEFAEFLKNTSSVKDGLTFDSDCIDDDLFKFLNHDNSDQEDAIMKMVEDLKPKSFLPSIRPHVLRDLSDVYNASVSQNILILNRTRDIPFEGVLYNQTVVYPDYSLENTTSWMKNSWMFSAYGNSFVLKDSWPENHKNLTDCTTNSLPIIRNGMYDDLCKSIQWNARSPITKEIHVENHNVYGSKFSEAVENLTASDENSFIVSTSQHLTTRVPFRPQNVITSWDSMRKSIRGAVSNSMAGSYVQGVPVCGDANYTTVENFENLCVKWYLASIVLPIFHVHSNWVKRDPYAFSGFARRVIRTAFEIRYRLLPYYYTVMNRDEPLLRGMFYEFSDENSMDLDDQFMVGDAIMVAPEFDEDLSSVPVYFPNVSAWYDLWGGGVVVPSNDSTMEIPTLESDIPMFIRGGFIVPIQEDDGVNKLAVDRRLKTDFILIIALNCTEESKCFADGHLYLGSSIYMDINADERGFNITISDWKLSICTDEKVSSSKINEIRVYGLKKTGIYHSEKKLNIDMCEICKAANCITEYKYKV